jgi:wyosine [tRNA(Phe)-imidazoG37] synthetase (radical SAM superfamily)
VSPPRVEHRLAHRYRIERAAQGYRVLGPNLLIWEPTLGEAAERREELEGFRCCYPLAPALGAAAAAPFESIVYGPVESRRLGRSLGINLTPSGCRVCNYACVYCEYPRGPAHRRRPRWPTPDQVATELREALAKAAGLALPLDCITVSGHGEPTLHPRFPAVIDAILAAVRSEGVRIPVRILTNGSQAVRPEIRSALDRLGERIAKLDADAERVSRPGRRYPLGATLLGLALLSDVTLQSCFIDGGVSNTGESAVRDWADLVSELEPRRVQIYTIDQRPAGADIRPVAAAHLEEIACRLRARTGIEAAVFG